MTMTGPVALYLPIDGIDVAAGRDLLAAAGIPSTMTTIDEIGQLPPDLTDRAVALMVGYDPVGAELFDRLPALRFVATHSAGFDMVDLDAARERGLWVCNVPGAATEEVATHALALALALLRRLQFFDARIRAGHWSADPAAVPRRLSTLSCGIIGMGRIGARFAGLAVPLFGAVRGYDPGVATYLWPSAVTPTGLDELLATSDCVSLHLPLTADTKNLLDAQRLARLRRGAVVINVSRGGLVDEDALLDALTSGQVGGAGLDVLSTEPPGSDHPLLSAPGVLLTPHVGYLSVESDRDYATVPAASVVSLLETGSAGTVVVTGRPG